MSEEATDQSTSEAEQPQQEEQRQDDATFTQAAVDELIGKVRSEERRKATSRYGDYDDLKTKATELEETQARLAEVQALADAVPSQVTESLRNHIVDIHQIDEETADLFLTATDPDRLLKQAAALVNKRTPRPNPAQSEQPDDAPAGDWLRASLRGK